MPSSESILLDAIKRDTTNTLTRFMRNGRENYKYAIEFFSHAKTVELRREDFSAIINGQKFNIAYKFIFLKAILKAVGNSMRELLIVECPCTCCLDSVIYHIIRGEKELRQINILDNIPEKHEGWIRRHTNAKVVYPVTKLSKLAKSTTNKTLVIDPIDFALLLIPFKDLANFQSIKTLEIHGNFKERDLTVDSIQKFINFINGFPNLSSIDTSFALTTSHGSDGFGFYYTMKHIEKKMFNGLSLNLQGAIHFGASVNHFENMSSSMEMEIEVVSKAANIITFDKENSIIQRKIKLHEGLNVEFSMFAIFSKY